MCTVFPHLILLLKFSLYFLEVFLNLFSMLGSSWFSSLLEVYFFIYFLQISNHLLTALCWKSFVFCFVFCLFLSMTHLLNGLPDRFVIHIFSLIDVPFFFFILYNGARGLSVSGKHRALKF